MENSVRKIFDETAAASPGAVAMEYLSDGERKTITYSELNTTVRRLAELFSAAGISPRESRVALLLDNCHEWIETYLALCGTAITIVPMDPKLRAAEVSYILRDSQCRAVVTDPSHLPILETVLPDLPYMRTVFLHHCETEEPPEAICGRDCISIAARIDVDRKRAASPAGVYAATEVASDDICAIIYTSGTTGSPKGAMLTHGNFYSDTEGLVFPGDDQRPRGAIPIFRPDDRFLVVLPLFHAFSFTANFLVALMSRSRLQFVRSLRTLAEDMRTFSPTILMAVPLLVEKFAAKIDNALRTNRALLLLQAFHLRGLVKHLILKSLGGRLRYMITGGAPCPVDAIVTMRRFGIFVLEGYGLSEASPVVSVCAPDKVKVGTIGVALPNIEARIDAPNEQGVGELVVRGPIVMKGYLNRPEDTAEALADGWLHTGDLASMDADGFITIRGRKKALIVNREGKNIYPEEVEKCLGRDKRLMDVLVLGYHESREIGEKVGVIIVPDAEKFTRADGSRMTEPEIASEVRAIVQTQCGDLATYKHPRKIDVRFEPLKRTAALKIRRSEYKGQLDSI